MLGLNGIYAVGERDHIWWSEGPYYACFMIEFMQLVNGLDTLSQLIIYTSWTHSFLTSYFRHFNIDWKKIKCFFSFFPQIVSQSNILIGDELQMKSIQKTFAVALSREMVPNARLVVYFIRQPEEVVMDVLNFFVNGTRQNQVRHIIADW